MSPFDLKSALLARHAQHVVIIHFPIALFMISVLFDIIAYWKKSDALTQASYYNLLAAALSTLPAVATGLLAWQWQLEGKALRGNLRLHVLFALLATAMIWLVWWSRFRSRRQPRPGRPLFQFVLEFAAVILVAFTGHLGGFLSGVNGPG